MKVNTCAAVSGVGAHTAACIAGTLTVRDAITLLRARREVVANETKFISCFKLLGKIFDGSVETLC